MSVIAGGIESGEVVKGCNTQRVPHHAWKLQRSSAAERRVVPYGIGDVSKVPIIGGKGVNKVKAPPLGDKRGRKVSGGSLKAGRWRWALSGVLR